MFTQLAFDAQLKTTAQGATRILIRGAATGVAEYHQLIFSGDLEDGRVDTGIVQLCFQAHFVLGAF